MITAQQLYDLSEQFNSTCCFSANTGCLECAFSTDDFCKDHCPEFNFSSLEQAQKFLDFLGYVEVSAQTEFSETLPYEMKRIFKDCTFSHCKLTA